MSGPIVNNHDPQLPPPVNPDWFAEMSEKRTPFLVRLFSVFVNTELKRLQAIKETLDRKDYPEVKKMAHSLKGASATLGCDELCARCKALETAALDQDFDLSQARYAAMEEEMGRVFLFMREFLDNAPAD